MRAVTIARKTAAGFTLVELMIVIAIIGILATIAMPYYQDYLARSKFGAALAEVAGGKIGFDTRTMDGEEIKAPEDVGLPAADKPTANCKFGASAASLTCEIVAGPTSVNGHIITLDRDPASGAWRCKAPTVAQKLIGHQGVCEGRA